MKKTIIASMLAFITAFAYAQVSYIEVVYLKNGNKVKGTILEQVPNDKLKIQAEDGSLFVFKYTEIEKITKEPINNANTTINKPAQQPSNNTQPIQNTNSYGFQSGNGGMVMNGTPLIVKLVNTVSSANTDNPMFVVSGDVRDATGNILIADGTQVNTETKITKRKALGRPGSIEIRFLSTSAVDGQLITLNGTKNYAAIDKKGKVIGIGVGVGVTLLWPMLAYLAKKGDDIEVPSGTVLTNTAIVMGNYTIK